LEYPSTLDFIRGTAAVDNVHSPVLQNEGVIVKLVSDGRGRKNWGQVKAPIKTGRR
jgi:hypothetical protein